MRAAVLRNKQLVVDNVPAPAPGPGQVLVETLACGICGSDLHMVQHLDALLQNAASIGAPFPFEVDRDLVMGHEFSARVLELGAGVSEVQPGDVVTSLPIVVTGDGPRAVGYSVDYPGGYGERMVLMSALCRKAPDGVDPRHVALTEPMSVGFHAVVKSGVAPGDAAIVLGCGPIGLACIAALRADGIEPIIAADFSPTRRALATRMGALEVVDPREQPAIEAWQRVDGAKPLVIFEAVGVPGMIAQAMRDAPAAARIMVVGACMEADTIWPMLGINKELTIQFSLGSRPDEFDRTLQLIASGELDVEPLITGEIGITGVPGAFEELRNPDAHAKILVQPALG
ncbi:MAG: zinc-binding dehydrogenase [Dehalococcoidia bacterium]